jgi:hypothetical protein
LVRRVVEELVMDRFFPIVFSFYRPPFSLSYGLPSPVNLCDTLCIILDCAILCTSTHISFASRFSCDPSKLYLAEVEISSYGRS